MGLLKEADVVLESGSDLDLFAWAELFAGHVERSIELRQRAFAAYLTEGDERRAGHAALNVALNHFGRGMPTLGNGWLDQAERQLDAHRDSEEHAWLTWAKAVVAADGGATLAEALATVGNVIDTARRVSSRDVEALALLLRAQLLIRVGELAAGSSLLDEVMTLAVGGCLGPFATSWIYCGTVSACTAVGDYQRAWAWTSEVGRCSVQPGLQDFPGDCRLHRAELLRVRGQWAEAESEVARVCDDVSSWHVGHAGIAHNELGQVAMHKGDLELAATEFEAASRLGHSPQPGLAALRLLNGEVERAAAELREALRMTADPCPRIALLAVAVEVSVALGELVQAAAECDELAALVATFSAAPQRARAAHARGVYLLATGQPGAAREALAESLDFWGDAAAPYEAARVRMALAAAELALGDPAGHASHLESALATFERLGAVADARRAAALIGRPLHTTRVQRALMFTDIEASTDLLARLGDDAWIVLLRSHDASLRRLFVQHQGHEIHQKGGGDGFFVVFNSPEAALDCAIAIQELLLSEQAAVSVRIGVHWAEVTHAEGDFSGRGVHEAARISALASGGEILASAVTLDAAAKTYATAAERAVELRGLPGEFVVVSVLYPQ